MRRRWPAATPAPESVPARRLPVPLLAVTSSLASALSSGRALVSALAPARALAMAMALLVPAGAAAQTVSLEDLLSPSFPSGLVAAPFGGHVAWVMNDEGRRNIWVASPPSYDARQLTGYDADDGQDIGGLTFSPDGGTLVFVRGGGANRQGENPNPTSDPAGAEQALWRIDLHRGDPVRIGPGTSPAISPRGDEVVFLRGGNIWHAPLDGSTEPSVMVQVRGGPGSLNWSPDGGRLAFASNRGSHAFIGVYDAARASITWLEPSVDRDTSPAWSPDGSRVAFIRMAASNLENRLFRPRREAMPWSIWVADPTTGQGREIWRAEPGPGSAFRGVVASAQLFWGADDHIAFPWERNGWTLLYSVPADGGTATLLTPGQFEVEYVTMTADRRQLVFNSNQDDIDRRHLWRVSPSGGPPTALTSGDGIEWAPTPTSDGGALAFLRSDARTPAHPAVMVGDVAEARATARRATDGQATARELVPGSIPDRFPAHRLVVPEAVTITATDGMEIPAQLFLPPDLQAGERRPALLFLHGGSRRQMLLGFHYGSYYHHMYAMKQYLAARNYVVLSLNFRSGTGYGMEFREADDYGAAGASEFRDVLGAGLYLKARPDVDPDRIGLWGGSYGGYLTAMGLARASDLFAAGVDIHGVHDWNVGIRTFVPSYNPLEVPEQARTAYLASPVSSLDTWRSPVLVISGDDDRNVSFIETVTLVEALRDRDVHVEQLVFPDEVHSFLRHQNWLTTFRATADFFDSMLGGG